MQKFIVIFTRSDTLEYLPNEIIGLNSQKITISELMKVVESRRRKLSKEIGLKALFAVLSTEGGQILNYNAHNF